MTRKQFRAAYREVRRRNQQGVDLPYMQTMALLTAHECWFKRGNGEIVLSLGDMREAMRNDPGAYKLFKTFLREDLTFLKEYPRLPLPLP